MTAFEVYTWPPRALARWVNRGEGRTSLDVAFYTALYVGGWLMITLIIPALFLIQYALALL